MLYFLKEWISSIVVLLMVIVIAEMLLPSGKMKKYTNLAIGFILIIAIVSPPLELLGSQVLPTDFIEFEENKLTRLVLEAEGGKMEAEQRNQIIEVYRQKIINRLESTVEGIDKVENASVDIIINEDFSSDDFGEIKRVYLVIGEKEDKQASDNDRSRKRSKIEKINKIEKITISDKQYKAIAGLGLEAQDELPDEELVRQISERLYGLYGIEKDNIVISRQEE